MSDNIFAKSIRRIADQINEKRRREINNIYDSGEMLRYLHELRQSEEYRRGSKSKTYKKTASMPAEIDRYFAKLYGEHYYKDESFFTKHYTEWAVVDPKHI